MEHEVKNDIMRPLYGKVKRSLWAVFDLESKEHIETTNRKREEKGLPPLPDETSQAGGFERPFMTGYYDGLQFVSFTGEKCVEALVFFLLQPAHDGMTFYSHFGGSFDLLHVLPLLEACGYSFEIMTVCSKIQCIRVKPHKDSHKKGWTFLDSYQLIPASLAKLTKAFNTDVKKHDYFDYDTPEDDPRWSEYLKDDCVSLYQTLMSFYELVEERLGGEVGMTTAATAMKTFRRSYQSAPIERHSPHHEFFREAYYGGRVEIYREEAKGLHYYDINSSYPYSMLQAMPTGKIVEWHGEPADWLLDDSEERGFKYIGFARANVEVPIDTYLPVLPYRTDKGKLIFPVGSFSGVWTVIELRAAIAQGAKVEWLESKWIEASYPFVEFITKLYELRDKDKDDYDEALSYVAKIMMNSLYGKFATNTTREKIIYVCPEDDPPEGAMPTHPEDPECSLYTVEEEISAPYIIPQIAAHITALSRLAMHDFMSEAHKRGVLAYGDTDSIQTTANLDYLCGSKLGQLKDEGSGMLFDGIFLQPKLYSLMGYYPGNNYLSEEGIHEVPSWATHYESFGGLIAFNETTEVEGYVPFKDAPMAHEPLPLPEVGSKGREQKVKLISLANGASIRFYQYKIVMKGYRTRSRESFETIRLGGSLSFESLEKIGAMVRKGLKSGPRVKTITRCIRSEETKRRHIDGITYPLIIDETIEGMQADEDC